MAREQSYIEAQRKECRNNLDILERLETAEQQTATTAKMSGNMQQITEVVYDSSRGATETAAASSELSRESQQLQRLVGQFRL